MSLLRFLWRIFGKELGLFFISTAVFLVSTKPFRNCSVIACSTTSSSSAAEWMKGVNTKLFRSRLKGQSIVAQQSEWNIDWRHQTGRDVTRTEQIFSFEVFSYRLQLRFE